MMGLEGLLQENLRMGAGGGMGKQGLNEKLLKIPPFVHPNIPYYGG